MARPPADASVAQDRSAADALLAQGRLLDAIDVLSDINRARPDPAIEERLVRLRHDAFQVLNRTKGRESWPPVLDDPFPDTAGLVEITGAELNADVVGGAIVNHGCVRIRGLLDESTSVRVRGHIERAFDARERYQQGTADDTAPWFVPFEPGRERSEGFGQAAFVRTVDSPRALFDLVDAFAAAGLLDAVRGYLRERPAMVANKWVLRRIPYNTFGTDFHQDGAFLGEGIRAINCWIALSPCGGDAMTPGLDIIPHRFDGIVPTGEDNALFPWSVTAATAEAAAGVSVIRPEFEVGDALLFDERLLHRTGISPGMTNDRFAVESWFFAPSTYPDKHVPVVI